MKDIGKLLNLGFTITTIILICLYIGYKINNYILMIIAAIVIALFYLMSFVVKEK